MSGMPWWSRDVIYSSKWGSRDDRTEWDVQLVNVQLRQIRKSDCNMEDLLAKLKTEDFDDRLGNLAGILFWIVMGSARAAKRNAKDD